jgi:mRNA deadenylase 3'-5' endonuclease subunit Ccr4
MHLSVATYNVLAQAYVKAERYVGIEPAALEATRRLALLGRRVAQLDADLLCLQEVEVHVFASLERSLSEHEGRYAPKTGHPDGLAVFWRRDRLTLCSDRVHHYAAVDPGYDHLAQFCRFDISGREFAVANTHLRWQPPDTDPSRHQGVAQFRELLDRIDDGLWLIAGDSKYDA